MKYFLGLLSLCAFYSQVATANERSLIHAHSDKHQALIVGVAHGLPGIDIDVKTAAKMVTHENYQFKPTTLFNQQGTKRNILNNMTTLMTASGTDGDFLFYFSGHGGSKILMVQDTSLNISEIRKALEVGRESLGPIERLVLIFDSCYSGSLLDPVRNALPFRWMQDEAKNTRFAENIANEMQIGLRANYWKTLFVFASSRADETSLASSSGGIFTNAMAKAFNEAMAANLTMKEFISKSQKYTQGHHPVARLSPQNLENEKMKL